MSRLLTITAAVFLSALLLVVVTGGAYYYLIDMPEEETRTSFNEDVNLEELYDLYKAGKSEDAERTAEYLIRTLGPEHPKRAQLQLFLGTIAIGDDYRKSISLYKDVHRSNYAKPEEQGLALQYLADLYMLNSRAIEVADAVFAGEPYNLYLDPSDQYMVIHAVRELYETAALLVGESAPQPIDWYRSAELHLNELSSRQERGEHFSPESVLFAEARDSFQRAESMLESFISGASTEQQFYALWLRGHVAGTLARISNDSELIASARRSFERAEGIIQDLGTSEKTLLKNHLSWMELYRALYLHEHAGSPKRTQELLRSLVESNRGNTVFTRFLQRLSTPQSEFVGLRERIASMAEQHSSFKSYLGAIGWYFST